MKMAARPPSSEITTPMSGMNNAINRVMMNQIRVVAIRRRRSTTSTLVAASLPMSGNRLSIATLSATIKSQ